MDRENEISQIKKELRGELIRQRQQLEEAYSREADRRIAQAVRELSQYRRAGLIFAYVSVGREVDTRDIISRALRDGKRVAVPRCGKEAGRMEAVEIRSLKDLRPGRFGIPEPRAECAPVEPEEVSFCVVPCLSADPESGARLGYGGGYYDRYLARVRAFKAALCREEALRLRLPRDAHDLPMDAVITENHVILYETQG